MSRDDIRHLALGFGLGLRTDHYSDVFARHEAARRVDWFEAISENFIVDGGQPLHFLGQIRRDYSLVLHGVSMSIGSADPLDQNYLKRLRDLADRFEPAWISDHLCRTGIHGVNMHDLLPLHFLGKPIMKNTALIASAMAAIIGLGVAVSAKAEDAKNEKCYGVAKAGQNDCATASNSCAGTTTSDAAKDAFLYVPTGICAKIAGGSLMPET